MAEDEDFMKKLDELGRKLEDLYERMMFLEESVRRMSAASDLTANMLKEIMGVMEEYKKSVEEEKEAIEYLIEEEEKMPSDLEVLIDHLRSVFRMAPKACVVSVPEKPSHAYMQMCYRYIKIIERFPLPTGRTLKKINSMCPIHARVAAPGVGMFRFLTPGVLFRHTVEFGVVSPEQWNLVGIPKWLLKEWIMDVLYPYTERKIFDFVFEGAKMVTTRWESPKEIDKLLEFRGLGMMVPWLSLDVPIGMQIQETASVFRRALADAAALYVIYTTGTTNIHPDTAMSKFESWWDHLNTISPEAGIQIAAKIITFSRTYICIDERIDDPVKRVLKTMNHLASLNREVEMTVENYINYVGGTLSRYLYEVGMR